MLNNIYYNLVSHEANHQEKNAKYITWPETKVYFFGNKKRNEEKKRDRNTYEDALGELDAVYLSLPFKVRKRECQQCCKRQSEYESSRLRFFRGKPGAESYYY